MRAFLAQLLARPFAALGAAIILIILLIAVFTPLLPLIDPNQSQLNQRLLPLGAEGHILGTDLLGRDNLSRLLWGTRLTLAVAIAAAACAALIGSLIGLIAGYFGGWLDGLLMRSIDVVLALPYLLLALAIVSTLGPGLMNALIAIAVVNVPFFARTVRGATLALSKRPFVLASRALGRSELWILVRHVAPGVFPIIAIASATTVGWMILETAGLSFLGLGAQAPQADLGSMLGESRTLMLIKPHLGALPGLMIFVLVVGINLFADGLRDLLDPRTKKE
ncbi:MAG: ABC transporter permease [Verrucomicrobiales bacterium]